MNVNKNRFLKIKLPAVFSFGAWWVLIFARFVNEQNGATSGQNDEPRDENKDASVANRPPSYGTHWVDHGQISIQG